MRYKFFFLLTGVFLFWGGQQLSADDSPRCFQELQRTFFRYTTVSLALSYFPNDVYQNQWNAISQALVGRNYSIPRLMKDQARRLRPNPLNYPFDPKGAEQLFRQVVWNIFVGVMTEQNIPNPYIHDELFRFIYQQEAKRIEACLGIEVR